MKSDSPMSWAQGVTGSNPVAPTKTPLFSDAIFVNRAPAESAGGRSCLH